MSLYSATYMTYIMKPGGGGDDKQLTCIQQIKGGYFFCMSDYALCVTEIVIGISWRIRGFA